MPQAVDDDGDLWASFGVRVQPAWVFVAPDGTTQTVLGALYDEALFDRIDGFLAETGARTVIAAIAFDLMDTVLRDPYREALEAATGLPIDELFRRRSGHAYPAFERGQLSEAEYWAVFADAGIAVDPAAFHRVRLEGTRWLPGMRELLDDLAGVVLRATASNYPLWIDDLATSRLAGRFERVLASCHLGVRKPEPAFFERLLEELALPASQVLFVDDRQVNVDAARDTGLAAHRFRGAQELRAWLVGHGVGVARRPAAG
jgi:HAD superfamily hydrolase (TIGR01509 family)